MAAREYIRLDAPMMAFVELPDLEATVIAGMPPPMVVVAYDALDVSPSGFKLKSDRPMTANAILQFAVKFEEQVFSLVGQVRWIEEDSNQLCFSGIQILEADGTDIVAWKEFTAALLLKD